MKRTKEKRHPKKEQVADSAEDSKTGPAGEAGTAQSTEPVAESAREPAAQAEEPSCSVEQLQARIDALEDNLLRARADYQNLQRRSAVQRSEVVLYANAALMKSLLSVLDDFTRSLAAAESSENLEALIDGVRLVYENFVNALRAQGLEPIEALHRPFDPNVHEAMMQRPCEDHPPGTVVDEVARGYRLWDRVLRPAKVVVSKAAEVERCDTAPGEAGEAKEQS